MGNLPSVNMARFQSTTDIILWIALPSGVAVLLSTFVKNKLDTKPKHSLKGEPVILITGCDSGLGYSLVHHCLEIGFTVCAGVLSETSVGANSLKAKCSESTKLSVFELDITKSSDIEKCVKLCSDKYLYAIINNAGVMIMGEFEWQTVELISQQVHVNLLGTMNFTKALLPLLRKSKGRIINMSSHCSMASLPGMSVYAAAKAGLHAWNDALRVECSKYGIKVISVIPGSFFTQSNILLKQSLYAEKMRSSMSKEALDFYGEYFEEYQKYVSGFSNDLSLHCVEDKKFYNIFTDALTSETPRHSYVNSPFRYSIYHLLFRITPVPIRDLLVERFVCMPSFKG